VTDYDISQISCDIFSLQPYYVMHYADPDSDDYIVMAEEMELVFSFKNNAPLTMGVILNTLKFHQ
jgi:hypothetical protein